MRVQRQSNGQTIILDTELGGGGEGKIYTISQEPLLVAKVYHKSANGYADKLSVMFANPPDDSTLVKGRVSIAWPVDLLKDTSSQEIIGFLMQRVTEVRPIHDFYIPATRRDKSPYFNYLYLHRTARNLAAAVSALHAKGYVIGDVNESNILVTETALVTLVDTDSFQVLDLPHNKVYRCPVGKPEFTPPELQGKTFRDIDRTPEHDLFGLAVVIFQLLMEGTHPFDGVFQGSGDPPPKEKRILEGHFPYGNRSVPYRSKPLAPPFEILHPTLRQLFIRCFEDGHNDPKARPDARTWVKALVDAENAIVTCSVNDQHLYGGHLSVCPWCERTVRLGGRDPFEPKPKVPSNTSNPSVSQGSTTSTTSSISAGTATIGVSVSQGSTTSTTSTNSLGTATIRSQEWLVGLIGIIVVLMVICVTGIGWQIRGTFAIKASPPPVRVECPQTLNPDECYFLSAQQALNEGRFPDAIAAANNVKSPEWQEKVELIEQKIQENYLNSAQQALNEGRFPDAIAAVNEVKSPELQEKVNAILQAANQGIPDYNRNAKVYESVIKGLNHDKTWWQNTVKEAQKEAEKITNPYWKKIATEKIEEYKRDEQFYKLAEQARKKRRWKDVIQVSEPITNPYWKEKISPILQEAKKHEKEGFLGTIKSILAQGILATIGLIIVVVILIIVAFYGIVMLFF